MKFSVYTNDIRDCLKTVAKCADPKPMTPILAAVKITADDNKITAEATNFNIAAKVVIPANIEVGGVVCVNARYLFEVVNKLPNDVATFTLEENFLHVTSGGQHFDLLIFDAKEFPSPKFALEPKLEVRAPVFKDILSKTTFAVNTDDSRPVFKGVNFKLKKVGEVGYLLQALSSNTHRISCYLGGNIPKRESDVDEFSIIVPPDALRMVNAAVSSNPENFITLIPGGQTLTFKFDNVLLQTRLIEGEFPPVDKILNDDNRTGTATFNPIELKAALDAAKLVSKTAEYNCVALHLTENKIEITAQSNERGNFSSAVESNCDRELEICFNIDYLLDYLNVAHCSKVRMKYGDKITPVEMTDFDSPDEFVYIATPVRI